MVFKRFPGFFDPLLVPVFTFPVFLDSLKEVFYYVGKAKKVDSTNQTTDGMSLEGSSKPDAQTLAELTAEGAPLHSGSLPMAKVESESALWEAMQCGQVTKTKTPKTRQSNEAEEMAPKTVKQYLASNFKTLRKNTFQ